MVPDDGRLSPTANILNGMSETILWNQQIERGVKALMKEYGPDIPHESLKAMKQIYDNYHTEKDIALDFMGDKK